MELYTFNSAHQNLAAGHGGGRQNTPPCLAATWPLGVPQSSGPQGLTKDPSLLPWVSLSSLTDPQGTIMAKLCPSQHLYSEDLTSNASEYDWIRSEVIERGTRVEWGYVGGP